jgi:hypothetical protein
MMILQKITIVTMILSMVLGAEFEVGVYNKTEKTWRGYNPVCDDQCLAKSGIICGENVRQCCTTGQCNNKYGFMICDQLLNGFDCDMQAQYQKLINFLAENGINI